MKQQCVLPGIRKFWDNLEKEEQFGVLIFPDYSRQLTIKCSDQNSGVLSQGWTYNSME